MHNNFSQFSSYCYLTLLILGLDIGLLQNVMLLNYIFISKNIYRYVGRNSNFIKLIYKEIIVHTYKHINILSHQY